MPDIAHVSDTALWIAAERALESERGDALFHDPLARNLAGENGFRIQSMMAQMRASWTVVTRTMVLDELLRVAIASGITCVVNLAAGLDARPWRLDLPATLRWIDVDYADLLDYKRVRIADAKPHCRVENVALDLADGAARRAFLERIGKEESHVLILTEGLIYYLPAEVVRVFTDDLHAVSSIRLWLMDLMGPEALRMVQAAWKKLGVTSTGLVFGPRESTRFFRPWKELVYRASLAEACRIGRAPLLMRASYMATQLAPRHRREYYDRISGIALLGR